MTALEAADTRTRLAQEIHVFRIRTCRGDKRYSNIQFATRSALPTVTSFVQRRLSILTTLAEGELRYGMAPPSCCERAPNQMLGEMAGDTADDR